MAVYSEWEPLYNMIDDVGKFYGIKFKEKHTNDLVEKFITYMKAGIIDSDILPEKFYARCVDGKIRLGKLTKDNLMDILEMRNSVPKVNVDKSTYEMMMVNANKEFTYCSDNDTFYENIKPFVGRYIMRHDLSSRIIGILLGIVDLPAFSYGDTVSLIDKYLKKERVLYAKKDIFREELDKMGLNPNKATFPMEYIIRADALKLDLDNNYKHVEKLEEVLKNNCKAFDISYFDALRRMICGMTLLDSIEKGKEDKNKYGIVYEGGGRNRDYKVGDKIIVLKPSNYNFVKYLEYLAKQEELELGV